MKGCPNCGRGTMRTEDWACQWCGYPLLSGSYKKIPKTFRQFEEERLNKPELPEPSHGAESVLEPELISEPEPEPISEPEAVFEPEPMSEPEAISEPEREPISEPEAISEPEPVSEPEAVSEPKRRRARKRKAAPEPEAVVEAETAIEPEPEPVPEAEPVPEPEAEPVSEAVPASEPEPVPDPKRTLPSELGTISDETELSVEQLSSAFQADKIAADAKLANKVIRVTGSVSRVVANNALEIYYIILSASPHRELWNIRCTFESENASELSRLQKGRVVTIQGHYNGHERNIIMKDCVLVR